MPLWRQWTGEDVILHIHVQPKANAVQITGIHENRLKIRLTAAPVDNKANIQLVKFLAKKLGLPKSYVILEHGTKNKIKRIRLKSVRGKLASKDLDALLAGASKSASDLS